MKALTAWLQLRRRTKIHILTKSARSPRRLRIFEQLESRELLAIDIVINAGAGLASNADALSAFDRAAQAWESHLADNITVTIDADLANLGSPNVIGQTGSVVLQAGYDTIRNQLFADAADESDDAIVASLPTAANATFSVPTGFSLNGMVVGTKASLKAAGFTGLDNQFGVSDAEITFNSQFNFDFDNSNGISTGTMDFETVAIHEIGHALGFISEVDTVDYYSQVNSPRSVAPSTLDLFRFANNTSDDPNDAVSFATAARSLVPGVDAITDDVTGVGNATAENRMSTGAYTGDGRQASHFKDNLSIGVMDPTLSYGEVVPISDADLRALDLIGYEISFGPVQNIAPVANDDSASISKKSGVATGNVLSNDTDGNGDSLTATIDAGPANGSVVLKADGSFTYTPGANFSGSDSFTYHASDGEDNSNIATVTIGSKGGGNGGGGNGGGRPNRLETVTVGFSASTLAGANSFLSVHTLPDGMDGDLDMNAASVAGVYSDMAARIGATSSARFHAVDRLFGGQLHSDGTISGDHHAAKQVDAVDHHQASPAEKALLALDAGTERSECEAVDHVMAELADTLTLPFSPEFWQLSGVDITAVD